MRNRLEKQSLSFSFSDLSHTLDAKVVITELFLDLPKNFGSEES
jgi:hypothetical protein